jgi:hypothetical protein
MSNKTLWSSKVSASMVKGWSDDAVADLVQALNEAVEQTFGDIADQYGEEGQE